MHFPTLFHFIFESLFFILYCLHVHGHGKAKSKVLLISLDGFRHDYFEFAEKSGIDLKYFKSVFKIGFKADHFNNVFVTKTFPNHLSIITGCYEETHGIIDNVFFDPLFNESFSYKNNSQSLQSKWFSDCEPIWATNILSGHRSAVLYWPGQVAAYDGRVFPSQSFGLFSADLPLNYKIDLILHWLSEKSTTLGVLYHPEPDGVGHVFGPNSTQILAKLLELDRSIGYLLEQIESRALQSSLNVVIVSDHGMTEISNNRRVFVDKYIDRNLYETKKQESYTLWGIWPKRGTNVSDIISRLRAISNVTVYRKEEIPKEWHYSNNRRVAPIVMLADSGWVIVHNETKVLQIRGMHGYTVASTEMMGVFMAWGPDIVASNRSGVSVRAVDVFPLIAAILKIEPTGSNNGTLANVRWMLRNNTNETGIFTSLVIICALSLITVLSACIVVSCAHYNANALRVQKVGNTYVLKSGSLVRRWQERGADISIDKSANSYKYKKYPNKKSKITEADHAFLLESNDEDDILGDIPGGAYKLST